MNTPALPRPPHIGDDTYNAHTGYYLGRVLHVAPSGETVTLAARNLDGAPYEDTRRTAPLTFIEPLAVTIARHRAHA